MPDTTRSHFFVMAALMMAGSLPAGAEDVVLDRHEPDRLEFTFTPGLWIPRLGGEVKVGPSASVDEVSLHDQLELDDLEAVFNAELTLRKDDRWQLDFSGFDFSTESRGVSVGRHMIGPLRLRPGDAFRSEFDLTSAAVVLSYWTWQPYQADDVNPVDLRFAPSVGVRMIDADFVVEKIPGERVETAGDWLAVTLGGQVQFRSRLPDSFPVGKAVQIDGAIGLGPAFGGEGGFVASLSTGVTLFLTEDIGLTFGYRLLDVHADHDDFELAGGLQGLFLAGSMTF